VLGAWHVHRELRSAINDARLVGGLFVFLGAIPMLVALTSFGRGDTVGARLIAITNTIILVGPGVWYLAAAVMMRRLNRQAVRNSRRVAVTQLAVIPLSLVLSFFAHAVGYDVQIFFIPAMLAVFFVPALVALLFTFRKIGWLMNQVEPEGHGFEALPAQVLPAEQHDVRET
jgi:hypothetical protein